MLKTFKQYHIAACMLVALLNSSCDKELSKLPANDRVGETAITDLASAKMALNGVYYRFANVDNDNIANWVYNNTTGGLLSGTLSHGLGPLPEEENDNVNSNSPIYQWEYAYKIVLAANGLLRGVEALPEAKLPGAAKTELSAEARFLRAYGHFKLLMYFAEWKDLNSMNGVLIRDEFSSLSNMPKKRSSVKDSYSHILADLDYAIEHAKLETPNYYANQWAAKVLKMRVLACRGLDADLNALLLLADDVIQHSPYTLEDNVRDIFQLKGLQSKEVILGVKPQPGQEVYYNNLSRFYFPMADRLFTTNLKFKEMLNDDPRQDWMIGADAPFQMYSPDTYYFHKFIAAGTEPTQTSETQYAIRLSEVYLLKAEAIIRSKSDYSEAKSTLKLLMEKAGISDFNALDQITSKEALWKFYAREVLKSFAGEDAIEWFTLIRMPLALISEVRPHITKNEQLYFPIPQSELDLNKNFGEQNQGYGL